MLTHILRFSVGTCLFVAATAISQTVTFNPISYPNNNLWYGGGPDVTVHADLNGDGREDFVSINASNRLNGDCNGAFAVSLSTGDGTYGTPVCYTTPSGNAEFFTVGDFNNDGALDLVVSDGTAIGYLFLNDGTGTLRLNNTLDFAGGVGGLVAADMNHDGAMDLVYLIPTSYTSPQRVGVLLGENNGLFHVGPISSFPMGVEAGQIYVGDFDGDGHGDLLVNGLGGPESEILYGDGKGSFTPGPDFGGYPGTFTLYGPADILGNGTMAMIGNLPGNSGTGSTTIDIEYGHLNRTITSQQITLANAAAQDASPPLVADFDGDGVPDIIVAEAMPDGTYTVNFLKGNGDGTFQPERVVYTSIYRFAALQVVRSSHTSRPDVTGMTWNATPFALPDWQEILLLNSTQSNFPLCTPLNFRATGINVCEPTATVTESSAVSFSFAGSGQTPGRDMEIWVDGRKLAENLKQSFSYYDFISASIPLSKGAHTVSVFSVGWDDALLLYQFPLTVGSSRCEPPPSEGLVICAPLENGQLSSPLLAWAAGNAGEPIARMEVWLDGVKEFSTFGSNTLKTRIPLASGYHEVGYYLVGIDGRKWEQLRHVYVP